MKLGISLLTSCFASSVHGQIAVTSGDFVDNEYAFSLPFSPFNSSLYANAHNALVESQTGTTHSAEGNGTQFIQPTSGTGLSSFTYRFNFTETLPTMVSITDEILAFNNVGANSSVIDIAYSIDGTNFVEVRSIDAANIPGGEVLINSADSYTIDLEQEVSSFFYRVQFDSDNQGNPNQNQFGRAFFSDDVPFAATFTAVPEPSSLALSGLALISALARRKRK